MNRVRNLLLLAVLLPLFIFLNLIALTQMSFSFLFGKGRRGWKIAVAYDQLGNTSAGGHEDETFSSRCWRMRHKPRYRLIRAVIDCFFYVVAKEKDHCKAAYLHEKQSCENRFLVK